MPDLIDRASNRRISILALDDQPEALWVLSRVLNPDLNAQVDTALGAATALKKLRQRSYDLLLTDWRLGYSSGSAVAKSIRMGAVGEWGKALPIMVTTAGPIEQCITDFCGLDISAWMLKPIDLDVLSGTIGIVLKLKSRLGRIQARFASLRAATGASAVVLTYCTDRAILALEPEANAVTLGDAWREGLDDAQQQARSGDLFYGSVEIKSGHPLDTRRLCTYRAGRFCISAVIPRALFSERQARYQMQTHLAGMTDVLLLLSKW